MSTIHYFPPSDILTFKNRKGINDKGICLQITENSSVIKVLDLHAKGLSSIPRTHIKTPGIHTLEYHSVIRKA